MKSTSTTDVLCAVSDEALVTGAQDGDEAFEAAIISRYAPMVRSKACFYACPGFEADDLFQEGMLGLLNAVRRFDQNKGIRFKAFAEVCVVNKIISALKSTARQRHIPSSLVVPMNPDVEDVLPERDDDPEDIIIRQEGANELIARIAERLTTFELAVFEAYLVGYPYSEIAKKVYSNCKAIDNALQRAKRKLNGILLDFS